MSLVLIAALAVVALGGRAHGSGGRDDEPVGWLIVFTVVGLVALWFLIAPPGRPSPSTSTRLGVVGIILAVPLAYALTASNSSSAVDASSFAKQAISCFSYGFLLAPFLAVVWAIERSDRPRPWLVTGAAAVAGLVANAALALHCADRAPAHLVAGHATIGWTLALLVALVAVVRTRLT